MPVTSERVELTTAFSSSSNAETTLSLRMSMLPPATPAMPGEDGRVVLFAGRVVGLVTGPAGELSAGPGRTATGVLAPVALATPDLEVVGWVAGCVAGFDTSSIRARWPVAVWRVPSASVDVISTGPATVIRLLAPSNTAS